MKTNWQTKKLGEVVGIQNGFAFKSSEYVDSGFFVMRITNVQDGYIELNNPHYIKEANKSFKNFVLKEGDILMSLTGNVGRIGIVKKEHLPAVLNQRVAKLFVKDELLLDKDYLLNFLRSPKFFNEVVAGGKGMAQQNVSTKDIENLEIPLLPLKTQKEIVTKLDEKFAKLREAKRLREKALTDTEKILYQTLREIFEEGKRKGWKEVSLKDIAKYSIGLTYSPSDVSDKGYIVLRSSNVQNDELDFSNLVRVNKKIKEDLFVKDGDILMCSRNGSKRLIGKTAMINNLPEKMTFGTFMTIIRSEYNPYLYYFFKSKLFFDQFSNGGGPMINQITKYMLDEIKLIVPPIKEQQTIVAKLDKLSEKVRTLRELQTSQLVDLKRLEKAYLREAFNGDLV